MALVLSNEVREFRSPVLAAAAAGVAMDTDDSDDVRLLVSLKSGWDEVLSLSTKRDDDLLRRGFETLDNVSTCSYTTNKGVDQSNNRKWMKRSIKGH